MTLKIKRLLQILFSIYLLYCTFFVLTNETKPTYLDCGKVVSKSNDEVSIKNGTRTELYLNIQFEKSGFRSIECRPTLYFSKNIGDNVCFDLDEDITMWQNINTFTGFMCLGIAGLVVVVMFFIYTIPWDLIVFDK